MKYALLIYGTEARGCRRLPEDERQADLRRVRRRSESEPGTSAASELQPSDTATTVRVENGKTLTTDGPFAETKEVLGGFYLIEADDLDDGDRRRRAHPGGAPRRRVEVRPLVER